MDFYARTQSALNRSNQIMGETFTYLSQTKRGVFDRVMIEREMEDGGYETDYEERLVLSKTDFPNGLPFGSKVTHNGIIYTVKGLAEHDTVSYTYKIFAK